MSFTRMYGTGLPRREPHERCEACDALGTVARLTRFEPDGEMREVHRFCARCWPEQKARYTARWDEEFRVSHEAWVRGDYKSPSPTHPSLEISDATWYGALELLSEIRRQTEQQLTVNQWRTFAAMLTERAKDVEPYPPMPLEVERIIAQYGDQPPEEEPADTFAPLEISGEMHEAIAAAHAAADEAIGAYEKFVVKAPALGDLFHSVSSDDDVDALVVETTQEIDAERRAFDIETARAARALEIGNRYTAMRAIQRAEFHQRYVVAAEALLETIERLRE